MKNKYELNLIKIRTSIGSLGFGTPQDSIVWSSMRRI